MCIYCIFFKKEKERERERRRRGGDMPIRSDTIVKYKELYS